MEKDIIMSITGSAPIPAKNTRKNKPKRGATIVDNYGVIFNELSIEELDEESNEIFKKSLIKKYRKLQKEDENKKGSES